MSESGSSIVLKRSKYRIGIDLVARPVQETAAIVTTDVVAVRGDRASIVRDVGTEASFQDGIPDRERPTDDNAAAVVAANRAIGDVAAANTRGPRISHTSEVVAYDAVGDDERSPAVVDASAFARSKPDV